MKNVFILLLISLLLSFASCTTKNQKKDDIPKEKLAAIVIDVKISRLEQELFKDRSAAGIRTFLANYSTFNKKYFGKFFPDDEVTVKELFAGINNKSIDTVYQNVQDVFGNMDDVRMDFANATQRIQAYYPKHRTQEINTFISGMGFWGGDMYVDDTLVVVALDYFLAEKCRYEPQLPTYILKRYRKENIVPFVVALIANRYNQTDFLDNSLIAEMIYYGKSYYFLEKTMPNLLDTAIAGYTTKDLKEIELHVDVIWAHFIDKNLLFETKNEITNKYVGERPNISEIGSKCPGRVGRWLGWQIVKKFMEKNPEMTLPQLMAEKDARKIFNISKFKPEIKG